MIHFTFWVIWAAVSRIRKRRTASIGTPRCSSRFERVARMSGLTIMRVPLALEIGDQRRAEMAIGLVAGVGGKIHSECVECFLADLDGASVARRADRAGTGQAGDDTVERAVHLAGRRDLVA